MFGCVAISYHRSIFTKERERSSAERIFIANQYFQKLWSGFVNIRGITVFRLLPLDFIAQNLKVLTKYTKIFGCSVSFEVEGNILARLDHLIDKFSLTFQRLSFKLPCITQQLQWNSLADSQTHAEWKLFSKPSSPHIRCPHLNPSSFYVPFNSKVVELQCDDFRQFMPYGLYQLEPNLFS